MHAVIAGGALDLHNAGREGDVGQRFRPGDRTCALVKCVDCLFCSGNKRLVVGLHPELV